MLIVVHRHRYRVYLFDGQKEPDPRLPPSFKFECALGAAGYRTPGGMYAVQRRAKKPDWYIGEWADPAWRERWADSDYVIPGGHPENPLQVAFLDLGYEGIGIHGTANLASLGKAESHGCIRLAPDDMRTLWPLAPVGTRVYIT